MSFRNSSLFFLFLIVVIKAQVIKENPENILVHKKIETSDFDEQKWWETATIYQIYPASFKDDDAHWSPGTGDVLGIIQKMPYLKETGITAILLSPFLNSNSFYEGDEILDYFTIDPLYGSENMTLNLIQAAKDNGLKVLIDFIPNHTSDQNKWFKLSTYRIEKYEDMYVWHNGTVDKNGKRSPPNNWKIVGSNDSAWTWNDKRGQYYLHQFGASQPDLNFRCSTVVNDIKARLQYWLGLGIDGFNFRAAEYLFEDEQFRNESTIDSSKSDSNEYDSLNHNYTKDLKETYELIYEFRQLIDNYTIHNKVDDRILVVEVHTTMENSIKYCISEDDKPRGAHFFQSFDFVEDLSKDTTPMEILNMTTKLWGISFYLNYTWMLGNYENHRLATRLGPENVDGYNMLLPLFQGTQITYSGEEIGMENGPVTCNEGKDPVAIKDCNTFPKTSRDFQRTPFQWDDSVNAGFNNGFKTWLPVNPDYKKLNLAAQRNVSNSHYGIYKKMQGIKNILRKVHQSASWSLSAKHVGYILHCHRFARDEEVAYSFDLVFNMGNATEDVILEGPEDSFFEVLVVSGNSSRKIGDRLLSNETQSIAGHEAILLSGPWVNNGTDNTLVEFSFIQ